MEKVTHFKKGDIIIAEANYNHGIRAWFEATNDDVSTYSGRNGFYYKLDPNNPEEMKRITEFDCYINPRRDDSRRCCCGKRLQSECWPESCDGGHQIE